MADEPENLVLRYLRAIDVKVDGLAADMSELKTRVGRLEKTVADLHVVMAEQSIRMDRINDRIGRIERRLDLVDEHTV